MKTLIIIPAYNEQASILKVANAIEAAGYDYVIVNDGSSDKTEEICQLNKLNYLSLPENLGIGGAVQTGHLYARQHDYDVDIQVDGDGQHDISYIPRLLEAIAQGADLVIGSRFLEKTDGFQSSGVRRAGINWLRKCIRLTSALDITDATSGFRASGRRAIALFCDKYPSDYPEPESIVVAHGAGLDVREVPVIMKERQGGTSSINMTRGAYYMIKVSLAIFIEGFGRNWKRGIAV